MSEYVAIDIETISNPAMIDRLPPVEVKYGNTKDPAKRAVMDEEARIEQIEKMPLSPYTGILCCWSAFDSEHDESAIIDRIDSGREREIIEVLLSQFFAMKPAGTQKIATWNGNSFDLPFIYKRAMILGIDLHKLCVPPLSYWTKKYNTIPHCDVMQVYCEWSGKMKLDDAAGMVLGERKIECDFRKFSEMITSGKSKEITDYCTHDAKLAFKLLEKANNYLF